MMIVQKHVYFLRKQCNTRSEVKRYWTQCQESKLLNSLACRLFNAVYTYSAVLHSISKEPISFTGKLRFGSENPVRYVMVKGETS